MSEEINYRQVTIDESKDPTDYHYTERRGEILQLIEEAGHPRAITQVRLAERYDVCQATIHKDFKRIKKYYQENVGRESMLTSEIVYRKAIKEYTDRGDYEKAIHALESWNDWLFDVGAQEKEPEKKEFNVEGDHTHRHMPQETEDLFAHWTGQTSENSDE